LEIETELLPVAFEYRQIHQLVEQWDAPLGIAGQGNGGPLQTNLIKNHLTLQQRQQRNPSRDPLGGDLRRSAVRHSDGDIAKRYSRDPTNFNIRSAETNLKRSVFFNLVDDKIAEFADSNQVVKCQGANNKKKHRGNADERADLEEFFHE
jgi:hypothetical protein